MKDDETGQEFHFDYNNWVRATLDNPRGVTELPAIRPDIPPLSETKYIVSVFTGSQHCADTEAGVFCNLIGQWGESGQRPLATPRKSSEPFKKGQVDEFAISSLDLGQLEKVVIGHSKSGRGQGWFCERVSVKTLTSPTEQIFVCNRWLDTGCDDRQLVRELLPLASVPIQGDADQDKRREKSKGVWSCLVTMAAASKLSHHTIDAKQPVDVSLVVCGSAGVTESFELGKIRPLLIGKMEEYKGLKFGDVGKVEKIRVVLGKEMDLETIWVLEEIILEDEETKETLRFDFSLFVGKVFTECYKELPAVRPTEPVKPVIPYLVKVHTSSDKDASTDSSVFITLFGKEGDSGRRHLAVNQKGSTKFQLGKVDEFTVEAVDLVDLEKVLVTKGPGDPWHLNKVVVKSGNFAASEAIFNYNSWLGDSNQKKEEVSTEIPVSGSESSAVAVPRDQAPHVPVSKGSWKVQTTTAKDHKKVPGLGVVVVLCGDQGETDPSPLSTNKKDAYNPGKVDDFLLKVSQDVGDLFKVRFGFSERTKDKMWKMQKVDFLDEDAGDHFSFEPNDRLIVDKTHDGWKELPIVWPAVPILPVVKYQVSVHIGDVHKIPPTMNMFIKMEGQRGTTGQRQLKKPVNRLQKDKVDVYEVEAVTLMDITKVTLAHDSKAAGSGFFLKKVVIKESVEAEKEFVFECEKWFDAGEDDKEIERVLLVGGGQAQVTPVTQPEQQEQVEEQQEAEPPAKSDDPPDCKVTVTTSSEDDSGTNAKVTLTVIGQSGDSGPLPLSKEAGKSPFVTGQTEQFDVIAKLADIGDIKKIRLEHDNSGNSPGWRVEKVVLENLKDSTKLEFSVNKHLSYEDEYGDVVVEVPVQGDQSAKKGPTAVKKYHVEVDTGESTGAGTDANVYITLYGEKGDSGKRNLKKSQEGGDMFEAGKIDTFIIEAVDLGKLSRVVIGHDSTGAGSSWKLDNVMVREGSDDDNKIIFHCGQWLDSEKGDGKTEREIFPQEDDDDDDDL